MALLYRDSADRLRRVSALFAAFAMAFLLACACRPGAVNAAEQPLRIVVFGDSLTAGFSLPEEAAFPAQLEAELRRKGHKVVVVNASVSGDTASGGLGRLDWALGDGADIVVLELGANDMLRGIDPDKTKAALDAIIRRLKARGVTVLLAGMVAAPGMGKVFEDKFNAIFPALANSHAVELYPFFLDGVAGSKALNLPDGLHPNAAGVKVLVSRILPVIEKLIHNVVRDRKT